MQHTITLNPNGNIEITFVGAYSFDDAKIMAEKLVTLVIQAMDTKDRVGILINCTDATDIEPLAAELSKKVDADIEGNKVALFGANENVARIIGEAIATAHLEKTYKLCATRVEAEAWLAQE